MSEHFDAIVVGSGAGGGIVAHVLAQAGADVLVLEKGPWLTEQNYGGDELRFGDRRFIFQDPLVEPRTFRNRPEDGVHLYRGMVLGCSQCVGGGSVHYGAVCFRFRPEDFRARRTWGSLPGADIVDWPLTDAELDSANPDSIWAYYRKAEDLIGVAGGQTDADPDPGAPVAGAEWRTDPYPMPGHPASYGALLFERAAGDLGLHPFPTPVAINSRPYDGRPACSYCGFCSSHGCPINAKGDTRVTALARALATGRCEIRADANVVRVEMDGDRARRVVYLDADGAARAAEADVIVLACSTVDTPRLVLLSELPRDRVNHDLVGRYLQVHHFPGGVGIFEERIEAWRGFWSMRCLDDYYLGPPGGPPVFGFGNIQTVGPSSGYPIMTGGIISTAKTMGWGAQHKQMMRQVFGRTQFIGMIGQDPPVRTNTVDLDPVIRDIHGMPAARVTYTHHPNDYAVQAAGVGIMTHLLLAMGATSVQRVTPIGAPTAVPQMGMGGDHKRGAGRSFPDPIGGLVNHQMGTMRMGADPDTSVVDPHGRMWGTQNLYVADASVFPTSGGYNPTLTIQALAWRTAEHIAATHT